MSLHRLLDEMKNPSESTPITKYFPHEQINKYQLNDNHPRF